MTRDNHAGMWVLSDSEMLTFSIYADQAAKSFRKKGKGAKAMAREAAQISDHIDSILQETPYYKRLTIMLEQAYSKTGK